MVMVGGSSIVTIIGMNINVSHKLILRCDPSVVWLEACMWQCLTNAWQPHGISLLNLT